VDVKRSGIVLSDSTALGLAGNLGPEYNGVGAELVSGPDELRQYTANSLLVGIPLTKH